MKRVAIYCISIFIIILAIFFLSSVNCYADPMIAQPAPFGQFTHPPIYEWSYTYGGPLDDEGRAVLQTSDNGYVIAGTTHSLSNDGSSNAFLLKTDSNGTQQWIKTYDDNGNNTAIYSMINTADGGYIMVGKSWPKNNSYDQGEDVYLAMADANGKLLWQKHYGGLKNDSGQSIVLADDWGYAILGYTESYGAGSKDAYLVKVDAEGNLQWNKTYGSKKDDIGYYVLKTDDGGYAITGRILSDATKLESNRYVYLIKTYPNGSAQWEIKDTDPESTIGFTILSDSNEVLVNWVVPGRNYDISITEANGGKRGGYYITSYGGNNNDTGYAALGNKKEFKVAGYTESSGYGKKDVYLFKSNGDYFQFSGLEWEQTYGGSQDDICYSISPTNDGGNILAGSTDSFGNGGSDVYLIKVKYNLSDNNVTQGPAKSSMKDHPVNTSWLQPQPTPVSMASNSPVPTSSMAYLSIPIIFASIALTFKNRKISR